MNGANVLADRKNGYVNEDDRALLKVCNAVFSYSISYWFYKKLWSGT